MKIEPIDATFGAVVTGLEIAGIETREWDALRQAFLDYALLIFPGQNLSTDEQSAFGGRFGEIESLVPGHMIPSVPLSNQKPDGSVVAPDEHLFKVLAGNEGWHTDSTYMPLASKCALLSAHVVPSKGGGTEWADMRAAYDALDTDKQSELEGYSAYHSLYYSQIQAGYEHETGDGYGYHDKGRPLRPLIKVHPETGRKAIYTGRHAHDIPGMDAATSKKLLDDLMVEACQAPRVYEHDWQPGDIALWDNRCLMHRARPYDKSEARVMIGTRIAGDPASELAPTFADERASRFQPAASNT